MSEVRDEDIDVRQNFSIEASEALEKHLDDGNEYFVDLDYDTIKKLLQDGAEPNMLNEREESGIWIACVQNNHKICKLLVEFGADYPSFFQPCHGTTPLHMAACYLRENTEIMTLICKAYKNRLDEYAAESRKLEYRNNALMFAVQGKQLENIKVLLKEGASINPPPSEKKTTALMVAVKRDRYECALYLLKHGADPNRQDHRDRTALHFAAKGGLDNLALRLLHKKANVNAQDDIGETALHVAIANYHKKETTHILLENGDPDLDIISNLIGSSLHYAVTWGDPDLLTELLDKGANINVQNKNGITALHRAIEEIDLAGTEVADRKFLLLLNRGADPNILDDNIGSSLHHAVDIINIGVLRLLLHKGANVNIQNRYKETPLFRSAACQGGLGMTSLLIERKANINLPEHSNFTPLHVAIKKENFDIAMLLLDKGAITTHKNSDGDTALHCAVKTSYTLVVSKILETKMDLSIQNNGRSTALHIAVSMAGDEYKTEERWAAPAAREGDVERYVPVCSENRIFIISALMNGGTDLSIRDNEGNTPMDIALKIRLGPVLDLFEKHIQDHSFAVAMMDHRRLGARSIGSTVSGEIVQMIAESYRNQLTKEKNVPRSKQITGYVQRPVVVVHMEEDNAGDASEGEQAQA